MDLIYTNESRIEQGILKEATCDFAYGIDENDFEITTTKRYATLIVGGFIYFDETEWGGRVDKVESSNNSEVVKYTGRMWSGILNDFVCDEIENENILNVSDAYYQIEGDAVSIVTHIVDTLGLDGLFSVDDEFDGNIESVAVDQRLGVYDTLLTILNASGIKMKFRHEDGKCVIYLAYSTNYSDETELDTNGMELTTSSGNKFTNHFLIHSTDEDKHYKLHLFTDEQGAIQPYTNTDTPLRDVDYILTKENQIITGQDEVTSVIEESDATENYIKATPDNISFVNGQPYDWKNNYTEYYYQETNEQGEVEWKNPDKLDGVISATALTTKPTGWETTWQNYYKKVGDEYVQLGSDDCPKHYQNTLLIGTQGSSKNITLNQWKAHFNEYYTRRWGGDDWIYESVEGISQYRYAVHNHQSPPSDWETNKGNYYIKLSGKKNLYEQQRRDSSKDKWKAYQKDWVSDDYLKSITLKDGSLYKLLNKVGVGKWYMTVKTAVNRYRIVMKLNSNAYYISISDYCSLMGIPLSAFIWHRGYVYTRYEIDAIAPAYEEGKYWKHEEVAYDYPTFVSGRYYQATQMQYPIFESGKYYFKDYDHFAKGIETAKEQLRTEINELLTCEGKLDGERHEFDIGDVVGGIDALTGEERLSAVTKKIAKIDAYKKEVTYEISK